MKFKTKRFLSFALALVLLLGCLPAGIMSVPVHAANALTLDVDGLSASYTDHTPIAVGSSSWNSPTGDSIEGKAKGFWALSGRSVSTTLTLTNASGEEAVLSFSWSLSGGGSVSNMGDGTEGSYQKTLAKDESVAFELTSPKGTSENTLKITGIALVPTSLGNITVTFKPTDGGNFTVDGSTISTETAYTKSAGTGYLLSATAEDGYTFFGWKNTETDAYVSTANPANFAPSEDMTVSPYFVKNTVAFFAVGATQFADLNEAVDYAVKNSSSTVRLVNNGILPAGNYKIPSGITLLIPFDDANTIITADSIDNIRSNAYTTPVAYRTMTMASGAKITVEGSLNVGGKHCVGKSPDYPNAGSPTGDVGMINMLDGSQLILNNGSALYCWGFIYGEGAVTAKKGSIVHEDFQFTDFRGGTELTGLADDKVVFPISQYYVQNIEVATTFEYGATEKVWTSLNVGGIKKTAGIEFIGDSGMFVSGNEGNIVKKYDPKTDRLIIDVNGGGNLNSISLDVDSILGSLGAISVNSQDFVLPINSNITININTGIVNIKQSIALLPGAKISVAKEATLHLSATTTQQSGLFTYAGGENLFIYSAASWKSGLYMGNKDTEATYEERECNYIYSGKNNCRLAPVAFSPTRTKTRTEADLIDAVIDLNGKLITDGYVYTTQGMINGGITSTGKTGEIVMNNGIGQDILTYEVVHGIQPKDSDSTYIYFGIMVNPAQLLNGSGGYTFTANYDEDAFVYVSTSCLNKWHYDATQDKWVAEHDYGTEWKSDATNHWHECKECGASAKGDIAAHAKSYDEKGLCDVCGRVKDVYFAGYTLTLDGTITMNFYTRLSDEFLAKGYITFTGVCDTELTIYASELTKTNDGYYLFVVPVWAYEMNKTITATAYLDGNVVRTHQKSIRDYAEYIINPKNEYNDEHVTFAKALLNYGAASQKYFDKKEPGLANDLANKNLGSDINEGKYDASKLVDYKAGPESNAAIGTFKGFNLLLGSETALRAYFDFAEGVNRDDITFTVNGQEVTYENGRIECANIKAYDLGKDVEFKATLKSDETKTLTFTCSAMSYCYSVLESSNNDLLKILVSRLYDYCTESQTYNK